MSGSEALSTLLSRLHTHLSTSTQLLPELHAQLGLHDSALADELNAIQTTLINSVDAHVNKRRKQVSDWVEKCEAVEAECASYSRVLGPGIKVGDQSIEELKTELVLPKRFEQLSAFKEKLRQIYHNKLDHLRTITTRLNMLANILGPDFYSSETIPAPFQPEDRDVDVSPDRCLRLESELVRGKSEVTKRLHQLSESLCQIDWMFQELCIPIPTIEELSVHQKRASSASSSSLDTASARCSTLFRATDDSYLDELYPHPSDRIVSEEEDLEFQRIFSTYISKLAGSPADTVPERLLHVMNVEPTIKIMSWATNLRTRLHSVKERREARIQALYDQLEPLWKRLGVSEADMDQFVDVHRGSTGKVVAAYEEELERMLELKQQKMVVFISSARDEIRSLWTDLMTSEEEQLDFSPLYDDDHSEELLIIHEAEISRLKQEQCMKAALLTGIRRYIDICEEEKELAASASDQSRLTGRGPRDPGRLLREEKMRKRVTKEKPRLQRELLASITAWEQEAGRPFLVYGESILQRLAESASAADQENKPAARPKKRAPTPTGVAGKTSTVPSTRPAPGGAERDPKRQRTMSSATRPVLGNLKPSAPRSRLPSPVKKNKTGSNTMRAASVQASAARLPPSHPTHRAVSAQLKRESFKPRPSTNGLLPPDQMGKWAGFGVSVKEEDQ